MSRNYSPESLVNLPKLSASSANVLITRLLTAANTTANDGQPLPGAVGIAHDRLVAANQALSTALWPSSNNADSQASVDADSALDRAWGNLHRALTAWAYSDPGDNPDPAGTTRLMDIFFADGLSFLKMKYDDQWRETQSRLEVFASDPAHQATANLLGIAGFVSKVQRAQADYGLALGITQVLVSPETAQIRAALNPALTAIRSYVIQVVAFADVGDESARQKAAALLEPLTSWSYPRTSSDSETQATDPVASSEPA